MKRLFILFSLLTIIMLSGCTLHNPPGNVINSVKYNNESEFVISKPVYDDLRFPVNVVEIRGESNVPEETNDGLAFDYNHMEQAFFIAQLPHNRKDDSDLHGHYHWKTSDNLTGDVVWCLEYRIANINEEFSNYKNKCVVDSSLENLKTHLMTNQILVNGTNITASAIVDSRIYRNATDSRDTYPSDAYLLEFDFHYNIDKLGEVYE